MPLGESAASDCKLYSLRGGGGPCVKANTCAREQACPLKASLLARFRTALPRVQAWSLGCVLLSFCAEARLSVLIPGPPLDQAPLSGVFLRSLRFPEPAARALRGEPVARAGAPCQTLARRVWTSHSGKALVAARPAEMTHGQHFSDSPSSGLGSARGTAPDTEADRGKTGPCSGPGPTLTAGPVP